MVAGADAIEAKPFEVAVPNVWLVPVIESIERRAECRASVCRGAEAGRDRSGRDRPTGRWPSWSGSPA